MPPAELYRTYCVGCHDPDGRGGLGRKAAMAKIPDFTDATWQDAAKDAELAQAVLEGKPPFMAPMKKLLSPAEAEQMIAFVRRFRGATGPLVEERPKPPEVPPSQPKVVPSAGGPPAAPPAPDAATRQRQRVAGGLYGQYCLVCHGTDGRGTPMRASMPAIPDFTSRTWQAGVSNAQLAVSILDGKGTQMPSFRTYVNEARAGDLAAYIRAFGPEPVTARVAPASDFEKRFRELEAQWDELQRQVRQLQQPPAKR
jgi:mono/diheme cytochrome c family protein